MSTVNLSNFLGNAGTSMYWGATGVVATQEQMIPLTGATGVVTHDFTSGTLFYHTSVATNFTANITNIPSTNNYMTVVSIIIAQGVTPYSITALQIEGVARTINWAEGITPSMTASKTCMYSFALTRTGSAWVVLGQASRYG